MILNEREKLLRKIDVASFVLTDTRLFLDTHPCDKEALCYYEKFQEIRNNAVEEYACLYGPITEYSFKNCDEWTWATQPWPWEREA